MDRTKVPADARVKLDPHLGVSVWAPLVRQIPIACASRWAEPLGLPPWSHLPVAVD